MSAGGSPRKRGRRTKMKEKEKERIRSPMGYPLNEITFSLFPELMSFQEYSAVRNERVMMRRNYSYWLPVYLTEELFLDGKMMLEKTLLHLSNNLKGKDTKSYTPFAALRVLPKIIHHLGVEMMTSNGTPPFEAIVQVYSHVLRLFTRILDDEGGRM